jgi:hypothetical protein
MTQNIYDDETCFAGYSRLPRSTARPNGRRCVPGYRSGASTSSISGCGFGWFCR